MTSTSAKGKGRVITLTRPQIESIIYNMGWEPEDADTFIKMAKREMREPGIHAREQTEYFQRAMQSTSLE